MKDVIKSMIEANILIKNKANLQSFFSDNVILFSIQSEGQLAKEEAQVAKDIDARIYFAGICQTSTKSLAPWQNLIRLYNPSRVLHRYTSWASSPENISSGFGTK